MPPELAKCAACGRLRPRSELVCFWPVEQPARRRFTCRPSLAEPGLLGVGPCFRAAVRSRAEHAIGPA